jgi:carboxymethylenebutenolidase
VARQLNDLQMYAVEEFVERYRDGLMSRRELIHRVLPIAGGVAATATLLATLGCAPTPPPLPTPTPAPTQPAAAAASAATSKSKFSVKADDPTISPADVTFPGDGATLMGYLVQPKSSGPSPAVLVCHEIFGLSEHIRDVTRRLAKNGYVALAVDLLSRDGGTAKVDSSQMGAKLTADPTQKVADFQSGFSYLETLTPVKKGATGMVGFCFGGGITWRVATAIADLKAAVAFYGPNPPLEDVPKIHAAILGLYGALDQRIDAGIPAIEDAMKQNGKTYEKVIYPGANHAFHNDTGGAWNPDAAYDAWGKTLDWFKKYLI